METKKAFNPYTNKNYVEVEHDRMIQDLGVMMTHSSGRGFVKYLFKNFGVCELPPLNIDPDFRSDMMGFLRAGQSIFEIASQANSREAGLILAEIQKEKYSAEETLFTDGQNRR